MMQPSAQNPARPHAPSAPREVIDEAIRSLKEGLGLHIRFVDRDELTDEIRSGGVPGSEPLQFPIIAAGQRVGRLELSLPDDATAPRRADLEALRITACLVGALYAHAEQLRHRVAELDAVYQVSAALTGLDDLESILVASLRTVTDVMNVSAGSIRLWDEDSDELHLASWVNLGPSYSRKSPFLARDSEIDVRSLAGEIVYVADLHGDPRVRFPEVVESERLHSLLCTGMRFRGRPVGVLRLYTRKVREFTEFEQSLLRAAAQQIATAIVHARLLDQHRQARTTREQLRLASNVQRRMLPQQAPSCPGFDIAGRCIPSLELGGDFYDYIHLGNGKIGLAIGDVVGKGVPAALIMASVRASLRAHAQEAEVTDRVLALTNRDLVADTIHEEFATVWYGVLDPDSNQLTWCNAGHEPTLLIRRRRSRSTDFEVRELATGGMVVGIDPDAGYESASCDLFDGDTLILFSDGAPEAVNFDGEFYGKSRVCQAVVDLLNQKPAATALEVVNHVLWEVRRFTGLHTQRDDITLVVVRVKAT